MDFLRAFLMGFSDFEGCSVVSGSDEAGFELVSLKS